MIDSKITYISYLSNSDLSGLDDATFYSHFDALWDIIKTPAYKYIGKDAPHTIQQQNILEGLKAHQNFLVEMAQPRRSHTACESFTKVWTVIQSFCDRPSEQPILDSMPANQQFLANIVSHNKLENPVDAFSAMLKTIQHYSSILHSRRPFPMDRVLNTFEMVIDAASPQTRRSVFLEHGNSISQVHPQLFERLSIQVLKEKLLAQKEIQDGLHQAPAHSKM